MKFHSVFDNAYRVAVVDYGVGAPEYRFGVEGSGSREARVSVFPDGSEGWVGAFSAPDPGTKGALSTLLGTPSKYGLLVVERGTCFLGQANDPNTFEALPVSEPVIAYLESRESGVLALATPWSVLAIDREGVRWVSDRLSIDGLTLSGTDSDSVWGVADPRDDEPREFGLNIRTGEKVPLP